MDILQRILFPAGLDSIGLYFASPDPVEMRYGRDGPELRLKPGQRASSDSYFNCYFQQPYSAHTNVKNAVLTLAVEGEATLSLWRSVYGDGREKIAETGVASDGKAPVTLPIPHSEHGRVYFELAAKTDVRLRGGHVATSDPGRDVHLSAIITTFKRETFVTANMRRLFEDDSLRDSVDCYVVDNGNTLTPDAFAGLPVRLIANPNTGGSGGFSRGMMEALADGRSSHFLIMDDDIVFEAETVARTLAFLRHAGEKTALAGSMLDLEKPHFLHEAGARWNFGQDVNRPSPLRFMAIKTKLYLQHAGALDYLLYEEPPDYGAFWFFAFPARMAAEHGLCMPFFILGDDIDFNLRFCRDFGGNVVALPGVGVRHAPFYSKVSWLVGYFYHRHLTAISAIHDDFSGLVFARRLAVDAFRHLCAFNYGPLFSLVRGTEDFLAGPEAVAATDVDALHEEFQVFEKRYDLAPRKVALDQGFDPFDMEPGISVLHAVLRALTLGGHLVPGFLLAGEPARYVSHRVGQWRGVFGHSRCQALNRETLTCVDIPMRRALGIALYLKSLVLAARLALSWNGLRRLWRDKAKEMVTPAYWRTKLGL